MSSKCKKQVVLVDGRNWAYRHGYTRIGLSSRGRPTGAIYGSIQGLITLNRMYPDAAIVFCWDGKFSDKSWRHDLCPSYKSNRTVKTKKVNPMVGAIRQQIPIIESFFRLYGLKQYSVPTLEADDLIGILATSLKEKYDKVIIYSSDRDFYQLIGGNVCVVGGLDKKRGIELRKKHIKKQYGVLPKDWLKFRAFVGDKGDKIEKPIKGIGDKKVLKILEAGVDASKKTPHPDYKEHWKKIRLAYKLSKIICDCDSSRLKTVTQEQLREIVRTSKKHHLFRNPNVVNNSKSYKEMIKFFSEFELVELMSQRSVLWDIR